MPENEVTIVEFDAAVSTETEPECAVVLSAPVIEAVPVIELGATVAVPVIDLAVPVIEAVPVIDLGATVAVPVIDLAVPVLLVVTVCDTEPPATTDTALPLESV